MSDQPEEKTPLSRERLAEIFEARAAGFCNNSGQGDLPCVQDIRILLRQIAADLRAIEPV
jgi:hypothetical protein